jgi:hypothetical protein
MEKSGGGDQFRKEVTRGGEVEAALVASSVRTVRNGFAR